MKMKNKLSKRGICLTVAISGMIMLAAYELLSLESFISPYLDEKTLYLVSMTLTRFIGGAIFLAMLINLGYRVLNPVKKPFFKPLLLCLPAFVVAINNFPFSQVIKGEAQIDAPAWRIVLLMIECLAVAFFEETAFRGVVFLGLVKRRPQSKTWMLWTIVISSVIFGLIHLVNLYYSDPLSVLMQIGYSALIGAMCSVVLIKTQNLWICILLHGVFNFGGAIVQYCGSGEIWDTLTVVLTAVLAVAVAIYLTVLFIRADISSFDSVYRVKSAKEDKQ